jgi:pantoate--beta-alanine ligase
VRNWTENDAKHPPDPLLRMKTLRTVAELRRTVRSARSGQARVGLVPTMGALHEGHLSLIRAARSGCDLVVVSLFVNPAQFNESSDLERYPRDERRDASLAAEAGADVLFAPSVEEVYPAGFSTSVEVLGLTDVLEGEVRGSEHFRGVTTVVTKLFGMVTPDVAYFGQKDAQQLAVIRRLVSDLDLPVELVAVPTARDSDGLALSSRNALLDVDARERASGLWAGLDAARRLQEDGETSPATLLQAARDVFAARGIDPDYVALVDAEDFQPLVWLDREAVLAVAARIGGVRLIDNLPLSPTTDGRSKTKREAVTTCSA